LAICLVFGLVACGGDAGGNAGGSTKPQKDSVAGFYQLVAFQDEEGYYDMKSEDMSHINPDELSYIILKNDNTAILYMEYEEFQMTYNGSSFLDDEGGAIDYKFKDGQLVVYFEDDLTFYYEKTDREGPSEGEQKGGEAFPEAAVESFEGDWHGWCVVNYGSGAYENDTDATFELIARFVFDENGNCTPYFAIPVEDQADNFQNITVTYDSYGEYLYFYGEMFGTDINEGSLADLGGVLSGNLVLEEGDDYASISFSMRRVGDSWDQDIDYPCMPADVESYYAGMSFMDIAESYGVDLNKIPKN
jgi:hypothetical protein